MDTVFDVHQTLHRLNFLTTDENKQSTAAYVAQSGGAPANVLCTATKFSKQGAFIGENVRKLIKTK